MFPRELSPRRIAIPLAAIAIGLLAVAVYHERSTPEGAPESPEPAPTLEVVAPTPTPPPWRAGTIAVALPAEGPDEGASIGLLDASADMPTIRRLPQRFERIAHLAWDPAGDRLAVAAREGVNWDVWLVEPGMEPLRVTTHPGYDGHPAWSPDGRRLAFESYRDREWAVFSVDVDTSVGSGRPADADAVPVSPQRLSPTGRHAIEPTWTSDGDAITYSGWTGGRWSLYRLDAAGGVPLPITEPAEEQRDHRGASYAPGGRSIGWLEHKWGEGNVMVDDVDAPEGGHPKRTVATDAEGYAWSPGGEAVAYLDDGRNRTALEIRPVEGFRRDVVAVLPEGVTVIAWTGAPPAWQMARLPEVASPDAGGSPWWSADMPRELEARPEQHGLVRVDLDVPGNRMNAAIASDFAALRADVRAGTGIDFLGTLSDLWRPAGFNSEGSAYFSWHKTGRAFDTQMDMGYGGMVLVREGIGRTMWRMNLRAGPQDGSGGRPLKEPGWRFAVASDTQQIRRDGGERDDVLPGGYFLDFTYAAGRYGWTRIPAITRPGFDWRDHWAAKEFWHYERRDGLRWFEAMREIYSDEELARALDREDLRARGIRTNRMGRLGIPWNWPPEAPEG